MYQSDIFIESQDTKPRHELSHQTIDVDEFYQQQFMNSYKTSVESLSTGSTGTTGNSDGSIMSFQEGFHIEQQQVLGVRGNGDKELEEMLEEGDSQYLDATGETTGGITQRDSYCMRLQRESQQQSIAEGNLNTDPTQLITTSLFISAVAGIHSLTISPSQSTSSKPQTQNNPIQQQKQNFHREESENKKNETKHLLYDFMQFFKIQLTRRKGNAVYEKIRKFYESYQLEKLLDFSQMQSLEEQNEPDFESYVGKVIKQIHRTQQTKAERSNATSQMTQLSRHQSNQMIEPIIQPKTIKQLPFLIQKLRNLILSPKYGSLNRRVLAWLLRKHYIPYVYASTRMQNKLTKIKYIQRWIEALKDPQNFKDVIILSQEEAQEKLIKKQLKEEKEKVKEEKENAKMEKKQIKKEKNKIKSEKDQRDELKKRNSGRRTTEC